LKIDDDKYPARPAPAAACPIKIVKMLWWNEYSLPVGEDLVPNTWHAEIGRPVFCWVESGRPALVVAEFFLSDVAGCS